MCKPFEIKLIFDNEECPTCNGSGFVAFWQDGALQGECCSDCEEFYSKREINV